MGNCYSLKSSLVISTSIEQNSIPDETPLLQESNVVRTGQHSNIVIIRNGTMVPHSDEIIEEADGVISFVYLFSSPLDDRFERLDSNEEIERLKEVLCLVSKKSNAIISFEALVATGPNYLETLKNRPTILYISSHFDKTGKLLYFEDEEGTYQEWTSEKIQMYFEISSNLANRKTPIQSAIIGSCGAEHLAEVFMEHGNIRHVVTVKKSEDVSDCAMSAFVRIFLENVLQNKPVQHSFKAAWLILGDDGRYCQEVDKFVLYQKEGSQEDSLSVSKGYAGSEGNVRDISSSCELVCPGLPVHYIDSDMKVLKKLFSSFVSNKRALTVLLAQRGYGSTTMAIRLAHHLKYRQVFRGIYFVPLDAVNNQHCEERDIVRCIVESLSNNLRGLDSCETFEDLISTLAEHFGSSDERGNPSKRILFIFDGCKHGSHGVGAANTQLRTTVVAKRICRLLSCSQIVSVLAICHEEVSFPLIGGSVAQDLVKLGPMSDLYIAKLLLRNGVRKIPLTDSITAKQYEDEINFGNPTEIEIEQRAEKLLSQSPIVLELKGMPAAARIFAHRINENCHRDLDYDGCIELAKQSVRESVDRVESRRFTVETQLPPDSAEESPRSLQHHFSENSHIHTETKDFAEMETNKSHIGNAKDILMSSGNEDDDLFALFLENIETNEFGLDFLQTVNQQSN